MRKVKMFSIMIVMLVMSVACREDDVQIIDMQKEKTEIEISPQDQPQQNDTAARGYGCSFPQRGRSIGFLMNGNYQPGKYYKKFNAANQQNKKMQVHKISEGGKVIVRVVGQKKYWWRSDKWKVLDGCYSTTNAGWISTNPIGSEVNNWDNLYFEIIIQGQSVLLNRQFQN